MSGIALLSDDLLSEILISVTGQSIDDKYTVAQVSRRWRIVALATPLLWAAFQLATNKDRVRLPVLLQRSGDSALEVVVSSALVIDRDVLETLTPHASRIRVLKALLYNAPSGQGFAPLLCEDAQLPALETLVVEAKGTLPRVACTPALRVLCLLAVDIDPDALRQMLNAKLETLELKLCASLKPSDLFHILKRCPKLVRLVYRGNGAPDPALLASPSCPSHALRTLDLRMALPEMLKVLDGVTGSASAALEEIKAGVTGNLTLPSMALLFGMLLQGTSSLSVLEYYLSRVVLRDAAGRIRVLGVLKRDVQLNFRNCWRCLATHHALCCSLNTLRFGTTSWRTVVDALTEHPLQPEQGIHLRIWADSFDRRGMRVRVPELHIPGLQSVVLACSDRTGLLEVILLVLTRLHSDSARPIPVLIEGAAPQEYGIDRRQFQRTVRNRVALEARCKWDVTFG
ncbi:hypothetical protein AURDEDRAFT_175935 [Auricularia subglabra TFB-10046 SS5]|nr:hypothetical protein AURDEDRAFT_175935 [Auricularia subglabra TFB-10046 SS5]